jgi:hypothetical protein
MRRSLWQLSWLPLLLLLTLLLFSQNFNPPPSPPGPASCMKRRQDYKYRAIKQ